MEGVALQIRSTQTWPGCGLISVSLSQEEWRTEQNTAISYLETDTERDCVKKNLRSTEQTHKVKARDT